jgi:parvulin-like peptidyl-prolyl isomerase
MAGVNAKSAAILGIVLAGVLAVGCERARQDLGLPPRGDGAVPAPNPGMGVSGEEPGPVYTMPLARTRTSEPPPPKTPIPVERPETAGEDKVEARLEDVNLPLPKNRTPLLDDSDIGAPRLVNAVLAQVNGEVVTREDILGPLRPQMRQWRKEYSPEAFESRVRQVVDLKLREAISQRLVVQEAKEKLTEDEKKQIEAAIGANVKDMTSQAGSLPQLEAKMRAEGTSLEEAKAKERDRMLVQRFLRQRIAPTVHITHSELLNYYNKVCPERYAVPTKVRLGVILIKKADSATPDQALALAEAVHARAAGGQDFAKLAQRYSRDPMADKGGDWGLVTRGSFRVKDVDDALFALQAGDVAPLIETEDAFYIVKALDRQEGRVIPFTEVQAAIENEIRDKKFNEMVSKYIQELYERSYVRVMMENL